MDNNKEISAQPVTKSDSHNLLGVTQAIIQSIDSSGMFMFCLTNLYTLLPTFTKF